MPDRCFYCGQEAEDQVDDVFYCMEHEQDAVDEAEKQNRDCRDCRGTGIGYPPPDAKCRSCGGLGYHVERRDQDDGSSVLYK